MPDNYIYQQYSSLSKDLNHLSSIITDIPPRYAGVAVIPPTPKGLENAPITNIVLTEQTSHKAIDLAVRCYRDLHIHSDYSQKSARRTVGVLWFSPTRIGIADEISATVERINAAKANIENYIVSTYSGRQERFEALRAECPGVMTLHLYRQIRCYAAGDVDSIRFTWQQKDSLKRPNKNELMRRIQVELDKAGHDYHLPLEELLDKISDTPEALLRERRKVKVQPVANIMAAGSLKTVTAPMPLILLQDSDTQIKMLKSFNQNTGRKTRNDRAASRVIGTFYGVTIEAVSP